MPCKELVLEFARGENTGNFMEQIVFSDLNLPV
jgi:hypothetical protein